MQLPFRTKECEVSQYLSLVSTMQVSKFVLGSQLCRRIQLDASSVQFASRSLCGNADIESAFREWLRLQEISAFSQEQVHPSKTTTRLVTERTLHEVPVFWRGSVFYRVQQGQ